MSNVHLPGSLSTRMWTVRLGCSSCCFHSCGCTGIALATVLAATLTSHKGLTLYVLAGVITAVIATFLALVMANKILTGEERIIYYHHEIGVMLVSALLLRALHQPLLPYLDITILGIGMFLVCGRIGCLLVGCCHGRPWRWGVRYGQEHAAAGFPSYLVGVRLFPVQAVESLWALFIVVTGTFFVWNGRPFGTALGWYVVAYGFGRFFFEFARGDAARGYWLGFSQPQWLSLLLTGGIVRAELSGYLPFARWHITAFCLLLVTMIGVSAKRHLQRSPRFQLLHPRHIQELATALNAVGASRVDSAALNPGQTIVTIAGTSLGLYISRGEICNGNGCVCHYTLSSQEEVLTEPTARTLADLIRRLKNADAPMRLIPGRQGVFHLLIGAT
jgi:prolipoprotein diacylglyceryltransferase